MSYIPPFKIIRSRLTTVKVNGTTKVNNTYDEIVEIVKQLLRGVDFDEAWYLTKYPDVAQAVAAGTLKSGRHHFIDTGYFEGRRPRDFQVDDQWYLGAYPDVAASVKNGSIASSQHHFNEYGYEEGRSPAEL
jgi:hypothetical protein